MFNTIPSNPFPPSTEQMKAGDSSELSNRVQALETSVTDILNGTNIDSFGDVETALDGKTNTSVIAPTFDETEGVYDVGDYVIYNGVLYRYKSHHSAGAWDVSEVDAVEVGDKLSSLESGLTNANGAITALQTSYKGKVYNTRTVSIPADNWCCAIYCCNINGVGDNAGAIMVQNGAIKNHHEFIYAVEDMLTITYSNGNIIFEPKEEWAAIRSLAIMLS